MSAALRGQVAIVTGGARGIGRGIALSLARAGVDVVVGDLLAREEIAREAEATVAALQALAIRALALSCDVTRQADCEALVAGARERLGRLDIVVCNAGVLGATPVAEMTLAEWERVLGVNATGTFLTCRAALPVLIAQRSGAIVNIASVAGLRGSRGRAHYSASKFAVIGFSQALAAEVAEHRVRVNCVCPAGVRSEMTLGELRERTGAVGETADALWTKAAAKILPLGRSVEPEDIGDAVVYLAGATAVTGAALTVSGGDGIR